METFPLAPFLCGLGFMTTLIADHVAETLSQRAGWGGGGGHGLCAPAGPAPDGDAPLLQQVIVADGTAAPGAPACRAASPASALPGAPCLRCPGRRCGAAAVRHPGSLVHSGDAPST